MQQHHMQVMQQRPNSKGWLPPVLCRMSLAGSCEVIAVGAEPPQERHDKLQRPRKATSGDLTHCSINTDAASLLPPKRLAAGSRLRSGCVAGCLQRLLAMCIVCVVACSSPGQNHCLQGCRVDQAKPAPANSGAHSHCTLLRAGAWLQSQSQKHMPPPGCLGRHLCRARSTCPQAATALEPP